MASRVASRVKLLQFYLFGIASQDIVFEALFSKLFQRKTFDRKLAGKLSRRASHLLGPGRVRQGSRLRAADERSGAVRREGMHRRVLGARGGSRQQGARAQARRLRDEGEPVVPGRARLRVSTDHGSPRVRSASGP